MTDPAPSSDAPFPPAPVPPPAVGGAPPPSEATLARALGKILAALNGLGYPNAAIGALGERGWVRNHPVDQLIFLVSMGGSGREALLGAARGEGFEHAPGGSLLRFRGNDGKGAAALELVEAASPFHNQVLARAEPRAVLGDAVRVARCEDLILLRSASARPEDRDRIIEILRETATHIDAAYLKKEAQAAGVFDRLKECWQRAKEPLPAGIPPAKSA